eukprot:CAMPEP_0119047552 /NCGR_PEP_ID=MMETSP1177-20130426/53741_1 /TAXON_ID=2985 /ORGANISM="Ochromonas sp, Strain CCMP1899" /LENGTH=31 /DNA_ID= /DNA_START= /DNA_END= /DNA_ORIENTATION=
MSNLEQAGLLKRKDPLALLDSIQVSSVTGGG